MRALLFVPLFLPPPTPMGRTRKKNISPRSAKPPRSSKEWWREGRCGRPSRKSWRLRVSVFELFKSGSDPLECVYFRLRRRLSAYSTTPILLASVTVLERVHPPCRSRRTSTPSVSQWLRESSNGPSRQQRR